MTAPTKPIATLAQIEMWESQLGEAMLAPTRGFEVLLNTVREMLPVLEEIVREHTPNGNNPECVYCRARSIIERMKGEQK